MQWRPSSCPSILGLYFIFALFNHMAASSASPVASKLRLQGLLESYRTLPKQQARAVAAIVGSAVADAATRPFHWLYDRSKLEAIVGEVESPAFWPESVSPFYTMPTGRRSCYNDIGYCMLRALHEGRSSYSEELFTRSLRDLFESPSEYASALEVRQRMAVYVEGRRTDERTPVEGPWQQKSVTVFLEDIAAGKVPSGNPESKETDGLCATIPLIAKLAADGADVRNQCEVVASAASILSSGGFALKHTLAASQVLTSVIRSSDGYAAIHMDKISEAALGFNAFGAGKDSDLVSELAAVKEALLANEGHTDAVERFGKPCANPGSFMGALLAVTSSREEGFAAGVCKVIKAGGCNCSRANLAGALLGAAFGIQLEDDSASARGIPLSWIEKTDKAYEILSMAIEAICGQ